MEESSCELIDNILSKKEHCREEQSCNHTLLGKKITVFKILNFIFQTMSFGEKISNTCTQIVKIVNIPNLPSNPSFTCRPTTTFFFRKLMFWVVDPKIIVILDPIFSNFKKHMLMWKIIRFSCTLCWLGFFYTQYALL